MRSSTAISHGSANWPGDTPTSSQKRDRRIRNELANYLGNGDHTPGKKRDGPPDPVRIVCRNRHAGLLRAGKTQPVVHPGVLRFMPVRLGVWLSARRVAVRLG